jgi:Flp pilus assembly protein TadG
MCIFRGDRGLQQVVRRRLSYSERGQGVKMMQRLIHALKALPKSAAGGAAVELAIVLPVLVLLAIGVSDVGRVFFAGITVANAARAGAQYGSLDTDHSGDTTQINLAATQDAISAGAVTVSSRKFCRCDGGEVDCANGLDCPGYGAYRVYIEVTVSKDVDLIFSWPGLPDAVTLTRTATFRLQ